MYESLGQVLASPVEYLVTRGDNDKCNVLERMSDGGGLAAEQEEHEQTRLVVAGGGQALLKVLFSDRICTSIALALKVRDELVSIDILTVERHEHNQWLVQFHHVGEVFAAKHALLVPDTVGEVSAVE